MGVNTSLTPSSSNRLRSLLWNYSADQNFDAARVVLLQEREHLTHDHQMGPGQTAYGENIRIFL